MIELMMPLATWISDSSANTLITQWLRTVPGLPPILQTIHLLGVVMIMASLVVLALHSIGVLARSQQPQEMLARLLPWAWAGIPVLVASGLPFVIARPFRYLLNPVFGIKMAVLLGAICVSLFFVRAFRRNAMALPTRLMAVVVLLAWVTVPLAGRWIAYSDYLFWAG